MSSLPLAPPGSLSDSAIHARVSILSPTPLPSRLPHNVEQSSLCYTVDPWLSFILFLFLAAQALHCRVQAFTSCSEQGLLFSCDARASHCGGFSLQSMGSSVWGHQQLQLVGSRMCAQWLWHMGSAAPQHVESSWIRDWTHVPFINRWIPNHRTTREVLVIHFKYSSMFILISNSLTILSPYPSPLVTITLFSVYTGILLSY